MTTCSGYFRKIFGLRQCALLRGLIRGITGARRLNSWIAAGTGPKLSFSAGNGLHMYSPCARLASERCQQKRSSLCSSTPSVTDAHAERVN